MIGLVLVTHGRLAVEFRSALEHVVGPQQQIEAVTIGPDDDPEQRRRDIIEAVKRVDSGEAPEIVAYVVLEDGVPRSAGTDTELVAHVHDTIGGLARPRRIVYVDALEP